MSNSMKNSFCYQSDCTEEIAMKFCTRHDSCSVVACTKFCSDMTPNKVKFTQAYVGWKRSLIAAELLPILCLLKSFFVAVWKVFFVPPKNGLVRNYLTCNENINKFLELKMRGTTIPLPSDSHDEQVLPYMCCQRFRRTSVCPLDYSTGNENSFQFSVDKTIFVIGFGLYGCIERGVEYHVDIKLMCDKTVLCQKDQTIVSDSSPKPVHVLFDKAEKIKTNTINTAKLVLKNDHRGHFGSEGKSSVTCHDVCFTFTKSPERSNGTDVNRGQIPEILFCLDM